MLPIGLDRQAASGCSRRNAFTLVELLVVVSIIALLIAILLPSLKKARDQSKATVCLSNMRQIGMGFTYYAEDYRQQPPPNRLRPSASAPQGGTPPDFRDSDWWYYQHMIPKHIPSNQRSNTFAAFGGVFECPAESVAGRAYSMNIFASNYEITQPFATNYTRGTPFNPISVKAPQRYILFGEAHAIFADTNNPGKFGARYIIGQDGSSMYRKFMKAIENANRGPYEGYINFSRHPGKRTNMLLSDTHVEQLTQNQVVKEDPDSPGRWISTLRVQWSPDDEKTGFNNPTPP